MQNDLNRHEHLLNCPSKAALLAWPSCELLCKSLLDICFRLAMVEAETRAWHSREAAWLIAVSNQPKHNSDHVMPKPVSSVRSLI